MKKCSACAKDLPDTAMHCVFCGAKQAPVVPASPQAKTVMGYAAADLLKQAGITPGGAPPPAAPQGFPPPQQPQGFPPPQQGFAPPQQPQGFPPPQQPQGFPPPQQPQGFPPPQQQGFQPPAPAPFQPPTPAPFQPPAPAPAFPPPAQGGQFGGSASTAATMFMQPAPVIPQAQPQPAPFQPPAPAPFQPPAPAPFQPQPAPFQPQPAPFQPPQPMQPMGGYAQQPGQPPFLASQTAARADKPVEPFNDAMKMVLVLFGALLTAAFVVPMTLEPGVGFMWDAIANAPGIQKLGPLMIAACGVLGIVVGVTPMAGVGRGGIAALLGLVPIALMLTVIGSFDWHSLAGSLGVVMVIAGLLLRDAYARDSLPRLFITIGAGAIVATHLVPFRIVDELNAALDADGANKLFAMLALGPTVLAVIALILAWIPGKVSVGPKQLGWLLLLWPAIVHATALLVHIDEIPDAITSAPNPTLLFWTYSGTPLLGGEGGGHAAAAFFSSPGVCVTAFASFGLAVLFGKQLEMSR